MNRAGVATVLCLAVLAQQSWADEDVHGEPTDEQLADELAASEDDLQDVVDPDDDAADESPDDVDIGLMDFASSGVKKLTVEDFDATVAGGEKKPWFVEFYAPWCGHCKSLATKWIQLPALFQGKVEVAMVDATVEEELKRAYKVKGFPTLILIAGRKVYTYEGERDVEPMREWAEMGYRADSSRKLPQDMTALDKYVETAEKYLATLWEPISTAHEIKPSLMPAVFLLGIVLSITMFHFARYSPKVEVFLDFKVVRDEKQNAGLHLFSDLFVKAADQSRENLRGLQEGDAVLAIDGEYLNNAAHYKKLVSGRKEFTVTIGRSQKAHNKQQ